MADHIGPWRRPSKESTDLYPGLVVHDGRVSGSITFGQSRLPVWAIIGELFHGNGWEGVVEGYGWEDETDLHGFNLRDLSRFLYNLMEMRGEFGRLVLMLANAERVEGERDEEQSEQHYAEFHADEEIVVCDHKDAWPVPWWQMPDIVGPLKEQLRRCLEALE